MDNAAADDATLELGLVDNSTAGGMVRVLMTGSGNPTRPVNSARAEPDLVLLYNFLLVVFINDLNYIGFSIRF